MYIFALAPGFRVLNNVALYMGYHFSMAELGIPKRNHQSVKNGNNIKAVWRVWTRIGADPSRIKLFWVLPRGQIKREDIVSEIWTWLHWISMCPIAVMRLSPLSDLFMLHISTCIWFIRKSPHTESSSGNSWWTNIPVITKNSDSCFGSVISPTYSVEPLLITPEWNEWN